MLLYWFVIQFIGGVAGLVAAEEGPGVAFWAHAGGFVAGIAVVKLFARRDYVEARDSQQWQPRSLRTG
jgi:membrane associated rhomboid family serine protease